MIGFLQVNSQGLILLLYIFTMKNHE